MPLGAFRLNTLAKASAAAAIQNWILTLTPASGTSIGTSIDVDSSGNAYATGYNTSGYTIYAIKATADGSVDWQKSLNDTGTEFGWGIYVDNSNAIYVAGSRLTDNDGQVIKFDSSGNTTWQKSINWGGATEPIYGIGGAGGAPFLCGATSNYGGGDSTLGLINSGGTAMTFARTLEFATGSTTNELLALATDSTGQPISCGYALNGTTYDIAVGKFSSTGGSTTWLRRIYDASGGNNLFANGIAVDSSNNVFIAGAQGSAYPFLMKLPAAGTSITFQKLIYQATNQVFRSVSLDSSDNVYCVGTTNSGGCYIVKTDNSGTITWARTLTGINPYDIKVKGSSMYITGSSSTAFAIVKLPIDGTGTGTYGSYVYSSVTPSELSRSYTNTTFTSPSNTGRAVTPGTTSSTISATTLTTAKTNIG